MQAPVTFAIAGFGDRGSTYASMQNLFPDKMKVVAVADLDPAKVEKARRLYNIPQENCFASAEEMLEHDKLTDVMVVSTMDRQHVGHAIPALRKGYNILMEKPISPELAKCKEILQVASECPGKIIVCHVLRYTAFYNQLKELIQSGRIGDVVTICANENVGYWHQAHSFVRGNWRNSTQTSPMILQKSCHDLDIISWLIDRPCLYVSSFGSLNHFTAAHRPAGAPDNCMDGCPHSGDCPYYAPKVYLTGKTGWPVDVLTVDLTPEGIAKALREGPYGRCVYACDNNVVDHQVVNMEYEGGVTASFTMTAFTADFTRQIKIMGTRGQIMADMTKEEIRLHRFGEEERSVSPKETAADGFGHGGGDFGIVENFLRLVNGRGDNLTSAAASLQSHLMCFAAEKSRLEHRTVSMEEMISG